MELTIALAVCVLAPAACLADGIEAISKPAGDVTLSFVRPGKIAEVLVKEGQSVQAGQLLVRQDDSAEQAQLAQLKAQAEDTTRVRAAKAQLDQKRVDLQKTEDAAKQGAAAALEVQHAKVDVTIAELSLELAEFEHKQDDRKYQELKLQIDRMRLSSPIAGKVEKTFVDQGESVEALKDVVRIVDITTLWVEAYVPLAQAVNLKVGQPVTIAFDKGGKQKTAGSVLYVSSVADAASETLLVRIELPNPSGRPAGQKVFVSFEKPGGP